jgi:hypothetical protein
MTIQPHSLVKAFIQQSLGLVLRRMRKQGFILNQNRAQPLGDTSRWAAFWKRGILD